MRAAYASYASWGRRAHRQIKDGMLGRGMRPLYAITLKLTSVLIFMVMASLIKAATQEVPPGQAVFFRAFFALPIVLGFLAYRGELRAGLRTDHPMGHLWRGLLGTSAMMTGFASLMYLPLPEASAIGYAAPILTVVFAAVFLGEKVRAFRLTAVGLGIVGVLIVTIPNFTLSTATATLALGAGFGLVSATLRAAAVVTVRALVRTETTSSIVFYFSVTSAILGFLSWPTGWIWPASAWVLPSMQATTFMILAGSAGGIAQLLVTTSYRWGEMAMLAPFDYASLIFAVLFGWFFFSEFPTFYTWVGAPLVIAAGLLIIYRERQLGLERAKAAQTGKQPLV